MKQKICASFSALAFASAFSFSAQADVIYGIYAGAQGWAMQTDGAFASGNTLTSFDFSDETQSNFYLALEHPIPFVPNVKVATSELSTSGNTLLNSSFTFGGETFTTNTELATSFDIDTTDYILYYEILDNDLISVDVGLNGKKVDGAVSVVDATNSANSAAQDLSVIIPMLYSRAELGLPLTGWSIYGEASYLAIDDNNITDAQVALSYELIDAIAADLSLQFGYRLVTMELDDVDDIYSNIDFDGVFAGVQLHF